MADEKKTLGPKAGQRQKRNEESTKKTNLIEKNKDLWVV